MSWVAVQTCSCSLIELIQREMDVERDLYGIKDVQAVGDVVLPRLRGCCSIYVKSRLFRRREMDSNHRKRKLSELQSDPFGHSGNCPIILSECKGNTFIYSSKFLR